MSISTKLPLTNSNIQYIMPEEDNNRLLTSQKQNVSLVPANSLQTSTANSNNSKTLQSTGQILADTIRQKLAKLIKPRSKTNESVAVVTDAPQLTVQPKNDEVALVTDSPQIAVQPKNDEVALVTDSPQLAVQPKNEEVAVVTDSPQLTVQPKNDEVALVTDSPQLTVTPQAQKEDVSVVVDTTQPSAETSDTEVNIPVTTSDQGEQKPNDTLEVDIPEDSKGGWGDPHYHLKGAKGEQIFFDHHGQDNHQYHLFSGDGVDVVGTYSPMPDPNQPQVIGEATIGVGKNKIQHSNEGGTTLNGKEIEDGQYQLDNGAVLEKSGGNVAITPEDGTGLIDISSNPDGLTIDPSGEFAGLDGIIGKSIASGSEISNEECETYDVTKA